MPAAPPTFTLGASMFAHSAPYLVVPDNSKSRTEQPLKKSMAISLPGNSQVAHKNAHHLHSIPPREKTTKTLILDHMLWLHANARFAQVRAEVGLPDSEDTTSDDLIEALGYGTDAHSSGEEVSRPNLVQARALNARAEGLEKVLAAMIGQPIEHPNRMQEGEDAHMSSPQEPATASSSFDQTHLLPNDVRLRLSLGALINDIFAYPHREVTVATSDSIRPTRSPIQVNFIPESLLPLSRATGSTSSEKPSNRLPSLSTLTSSKISPSAPRVASSNSAIFNSHTWAQPLSVVGMLFSRFITLDLTDLIM